MAKAKPKAWGLDLIPPEVGKRDPQLMCMIYLPLFVKASMCVTEPIQWKGGAMCEIPKDGKDHKLCSGHRGVLVSDYSVWSQSCAVVTEVVAFQRLGFSPDVWQEFRQVASEQCVVEQASMDAHTRILAHEAHQDTWFAVDGAKGVTKTSLGSRPGDPLGDIVFNFLMAKVLHAVESAMREAGLGVQFQVGRDVFSRLRRDTVVRVFDDSYVDDGAFFAMHRRAQELKRQMECLIRIVTHQFEKHRGKEDAERDPCGTEGSVESSPGRGERDGSACR
eukprot:10536650-Alexandrium_andersonii.AAC.1